MNTRSPMTRYTSGEYLSAVICIIGLRCGDNSISICSFHHLHSFERITERRKLREEFSIWVFRLEVFYLSKILRTVLPYTYTDQCLGLIFAFTMAPDITTVSVDIRVPPMFITDHAVLNNFPELFNTKQGSLVTFNQRLRSSPQTIANSKENITCPDTLSKDTSLLPDMTYTEDFIKKGSSGETPVCDREEADDLFDSEYVLPDNCQWWQQVDDLSFEAPIGDFDVVDLPHFGDNLNYSGLWEDVDTFVSVAENDVTEERAVHEPVYCLDTRKTTVWGLDIIWEDEEHNCEILE